MHRHLRTVLLGVVALVGSALLPVSTAATVPGAASTSAPALWYVAHNQSLHLRVSASKTIALTGEFGSFTDPQWSASRHLLAYTQFVGSNKLKVTSVTAAGAQSDQFTCTCDGGAVWRGGSLAAMYQHRLVIRDVVAHTTKTISLSGAHFVNGDDITAYPAALVGVGHSVLFSAATRKGTSAYGGPESLFMASASGKVRKLHAAGGNTGVFAAHLAADGTHVAYEIEDHGGFCADYPRIGILNLHSGSVSYPKLPHLNRPWTVLSLRYQGNRLYAGIAATPKSCVHGNGSKPQRTTPVRYRVTAHHFVHPTRGLIDKATSKAWVATTSGKVKINGVGGDPGSKLVITHGSRPITVAAKAYDFGWL